MTFLLVDTGPLVALIRKADRDHQRCVDVAAQVTSPLLTTWPVLTEAAWLLRGDRRDVDALLQMVPRGFLHIDPLDLDAVAWIRDFLERYADQQPQLADATLMYLAEARNLDTVFTLDVRDFSVYRTAGGGVLNLVPQ